MLRIQHITSAGIELQVCIQLFQEYAQELNEDLCFQSFDAELENPLKNMVHQQALYYWLIGIINL